MDTFNAYVKQKYGPIQVDNDCQANGQAGHRRLSEDWKERVDIPLTTDELHHAVTKGGGNKAPGRDGIGAEFFSVTWEELFSTIFFGRKVTGEQKRGVIVCIPKTVKPIYPTDFRSITLLNTGYKIMARILGNRIQLALLEMLHPSQHCGITKKSIFDAVATVQDAIAYDETASIALCVLSLDFKAAFDKISHTYLVTILKSHGSSDAFIEGIKHMYTNATLAVEINGHISGPIQIRSSVR
jgi:hypothetical protein